MGSSGAWGSGNSGDPTRVILGGNGKENGKYNGLYVEIMLGIYWELESSELGFQSCWLRPLFAERC